MQKIYCEDGKEIVANGNVGDILYFYSSPSWWHKSIIIKNDGDILNFFIFSAKTSFSSLKYKSAYITKYYSHSDIQFEVWKTGDKDVQK